MRILAITIKQPWASLIIAGHKDVENRTWNTEHRGILVIHAGKSRDPTGTPAALAAGLKPHSLPGGVALGFVVLADVTTDHSSEWAIPGFLHWVLTDPTPFPEPIPDRGALGLWAPSPDVVDRVGDAMPGLLPRSRLRRG